MYKRYIKRGGKVYGPYAYHSEKKDGKVISRYLGKKPNNKIKEYGWFFIFIAVLLLLLFIGSLFFSKLVLTGLFMGNITPIVLDNGQWKVTHTTDYDYTLYIADLKDKKTTLGLIPNNGVCPKDTKQLYDRDNNLILDDKDKPITLKCESSKCDGKNCYSITLTDAQAVNIDDYVRIGEESTTYEWVDSILYIYDTDTYDVNGFEIEIYTDETKIESPDIKWVEDNPTDNKIDFYPNLSNIEYPLDGVSFKVNELIIPKTRVSINPYYSVISNWVLDFSTFESKNNITNKTIKTIYGKEDEFGFKEILGYLISYYGIIFDLDPVLNLVIDGASDLIFTNITEGSAQGARLDAPVLYMGFNEPPENLTAGNYINGINDYVQDNSVYNNYGDAGNLKDDGMWVNGNWSGGLEFDGVDDYVTATLSPAIGTADNFSYGGWFYIEDLSRVWQCVMSDSSGSKYGLYAMHSNSRPFFYHYNSTPSIFYLYGNAWTTIGWHHLLIIRNGTNYSFYQDGVYTTSTTNGDASETFNDLRIGNGGLRYFNGVADEIYIFNKSLNSTEINELYTSNSITTASANLISHWALNETSGTTASDSVGSNDGTLTNYKTHSPTYNSSCTAFSGSGGCYEFADGLDYITLSDTFTFGLDDSFTVSAWIKTNSVTGERFAIGRDVPGNNIIALYHTNVDACFRIRDTDGGTVDGVCYPNTLTADTWYHLVGVRDVESDTINIYVNGIAYSTPTTDSSNTNITLRLRIGGDNTGSNYAIFSWNGSIDDVRIWDRALSSDEIATLYADATSQGKYAKSGDFKSLVFYNSTPVYWNTTFSMANSSGQGVDLTDPNLVSYWKLDENYLDSKGTNHGTCTNCPNNATGLSSDAMRFDGVDDGITLGTQTLYNNASISVWVKLNSLSTSRAIYDANYVHLHYDHSNCVNNDICLAVHDGVSFKYVDLPSGSTSANIWYHIVATYGSDGNLKIYQNGVLKNTTSGYDGTLGSNSQLTAIGQKRLGGEYWNGLIDEFLIYNDTLTEDEITNLYKTGLSQHASTNISLQTRTATSYNLTDTGLVSQWSFNSDNNGTDEMGLNNGSCDSASTCPIWSEDYGVVGGGYKFDGTNDYVNLSNDESLNITGNITLSAWVKRDGDCQSNWCALFQKTDYTDAYGILYNSDSDYLRFYHNGLSSSFSQGNFELETNKWYYIVTTYNGSKTKIYLNGVLSDEYDITGTIDSNSKSLLIGKVDRDDTPYYMFNGSIDEVRIYNRSLSASEVQDLYELGDKYILWNDWSSATLMNDDVTNMTNDFGNFFQFQTLFTSNDTEVSPYLINHTVGFGKEAVPPQVTIVSPTAGQTLSSSSVSFEIRTNENSTCNYSLDAGATNYSMTANATGTGHTSTQTLSNANYVANFYCSDLAGNLNNTESVSFTVSVSAGNGGVSTTVGGGGGIAPSLKFSTGVSSIQRTLALNRIEFGQVEVTNNGDGSATFTAYVEVLDDIITLEQTSLTLEPGQSGIFEFKLTPPDDTGIYTGKIIIKSGSVIKEILTTINVRTEKSLFDITLHIPKFMKTIKTSGILRAQINLLQMGLKEKIDVTLNYVIKDFNGVVHLTESETFAVLDQKSVSKEFHTEELPPGDYVLGTELIYPDGVAVASSQFKIEPRLGLSTKNIVLATIVVVALAVLIVVYLVIRRYRKMLKHIKEKV